MTLWWIGTRREQGGVKGGGTSPCAANGTTEFLLAAVSIKSEHQMKLDDGKRVCSQDCKILIRGQDTSVPRPALSPLPVSPFYSVSCVFLRLKKKKKLHGYHSCTGSSVIAYKMGPSTVFLLYDNKSGEKRRRHH